MSALARLTPGHFHSCHRANVQGEPPVAAVDTKHPDYLAHEGEWQLMRDTERGPVAIGEAGISYLPMPSGFTTQPDGGVAMYGAYKQRARFPDIVAPTVRGMTGLIHRKPAQIEMPAMMEPLREKCTVEGLTLDAFHSTITQELLRVGRFGVLADASPQGSDIPWLAGYTTEAIINWSAEGDFFVLDESGLQRKEFIWEMQNQYRVLEMGPNGYQQRVYSSNADTGITVQPMARGNGELEGIPFVIATPNELSNFIGEIPLIGVARSGVAMYQLDADYRLQLFMSGQETLFVIGVDDPPKIVGASVRVAVPMGGDAKYVGPSGAGIAAHKVAIDDAKEDAVAAGAALFDTRAESSQESGEAKRLRYGAQTATLQTIAKTSAALLEKALRNIAIFLKQNPDTVTVKPNLRFIDVVMTPSDAEALMRVWMGGGVSKQTFFENLQRGDIISEDRTFEEEEALIEKDEMDRAAKADEQMERERAAAVPAMGPGDGEEELEGEE